jgi:hypothetical protein
VDVLKILLEHPRNVLGKPSICCQLLILQNKLLCLLLVSFLGTLSGKGTSERV